MEYISGVLMSSLLGKINEQVAVKYIRQIANAVKAIHAEGLLHQDIKPDNIIIKDSGDIKIIDFGSSSDFADDKTRTYEKILTHGYAPLEQYGGKGRRGEFTDVYAICATLYACIKGAPPPEATALAGGTSIDFNGISEELRSIIEKGLSIKIPDRIQNTDELIKLLDTLDTLDTNEEKRRISESEDKGTFKTSEILKGAEKSPQNMYKSESVSLSKSESKSVLSETPNEKTNKQSVKSPAQSLSQQNNQYDEQYSNQYSRVQSSDTDNICNENDGNNEINNSSYNGNGNIYNNGAAE